jgi:hypothetical protein
MADKLDFLDGLPMELQIQILKDLSESRDDRHDEVSINIDDEVYTIPKAVNDLIECLHQDLQERTSGVPKN